MDNSRFYVLNTASTSEFNRTTGWGQSAKIAAHPTLSSLRVYCAKMQFLNNKIRIKTGASRRLADYTSEALRLKEQIQQEQADHYERIFKYCPYF